MSKYYYELDFSAVSCHFHISVNDVELLSMEIDGQTRADVPINHLILESGSQTIEMKALPLKDQATLHKDACVRYRVNVFDMSSGDYVFIKQFEEFYTPGVKEDIPVTFHKSSFEAEVPYILDAWQHSENLKELKTDIKAILVAEYHKIINQINDRHYKEFIEQYAKRERNNAIAMYLTEDEAQNRIKKLIYDFDNGFVGQPVGSDIFVEYSAYGKLACLKRKNGLSALYLENMQTEEELVLQLAFHIPNGKTAFEII